jgi:hypothetical protein
MQYIKIKSATKSEIEAVRKGVDFQRYFDTHIVPAMPDYYSGSHSVDFIANNNKCNCPFHTEDTPSFSLKTWVDGITTFICFGCDLKGDIVKLHQYFRQREQDVSLTYSQAAKELYDEFIEGRQVSKAPVNTNIKLKSDVVVELSTLQEKVAFQFSLDKIEKFLQNKTVDISSKAAYYSLMDKLNYLVSNNLLNATEAKNKLEEEYKKL